MKFTLETPFRSFYLMLSLVGVFIDSLIPRRFTQPWNFDVTVIYLHLLAIFSIPVLFTARFTVREMFRRSLFLLSLTIVLLSEMWIRSIIGDPEVSFLPLLLRYEAVLICFTLSNLTTPKIEMYLRSILILITTSMVLAILYSFYGFQIAAYLDSELRLLSSGGGFIRATSPIGGPNLVGLVCTVSLPYVIYYINRNPFWSISAAIFIVALILTGSKTSFISCVVGLGVYYLLSQKYRHLKAAEIIPLFLLISLMSWAVMKTRVITMFSSLNAGGSNRLDVWQEAISLANFKLFGYGTDYWINSPNAPFSAHNLWLELVLDYGWVRGLIAWFILLIFFSSTFSKGLANRYQGGAALGSSIVGLLVASLGDYHFWEPRVLLLTAVLAGLGIAVFGVKRSETTSGNR